MLNTIRVVLICLFILSLPKANAVTTNEIPNYVPPKIEKAVRTTVLRHKMTQEVPEEYKMMIQSYAEKYNVGEAILTSVIRCESNFNTYALGDGGHSRGLVQIHNLYHPNVSDEEAYNPDFAISFLAEAISEGRGSQWTCYRKLSTAQN